MNRFLAAVLRVMNGIIAILIIGLALLAGYTIWLSGEFGDLPLVASLILSGAIGVFLALLICGLIALFIDIRNKLYHIDEHLKALRFPVPGTGGSGLTAGTGSLSGQRHEPVLRRSTQTEVDDGANT